MKPLKIYCWLTAFLIAWSIPTLAQKNITLRSQLTFPGKNLANIGGYVDSLGNEYALVGHSKGMSIVNVQDPDNPFVVKEITGPTSDWREVKTWGKYAYVTTEGGQKGLQIVDLSHLPDTVIPFHYWSPTIGNNVLKTIHALHIDNGYVYLYGANNGSSIDGIIIADLSDPWNPVFAGMYNNFYVHDGYVRNDTVWACHIYDGFFSAIDVSDKANPVQLAQQSTPSNFTHNSWLSDNSRYLFTTDEVNNSYLAAYDVSDINNIILMDKIQSQNAGQNSIVHNVHILNDYAVTSWYKDGVVITDGHRPENLINVGWYDTSPFSGGGFKGCWGVYPFLPSGNLVASDMEQGLFVLTPTYTRACYLEGTVTDSICGENLNGVKVTIVGAGVIDSTNVVGEYKTGSPDSGTYTVTFQKQGYNTVTLNNIVLDHGIVTNLNVQMTSNLTVSLSGTVSDDDGNTLQGVPVLISNSSLAYNDVTDSNGEFNQCGLSSGNYDLYAGTWGYINYCDNSNITNSHLNITLVPGIYDDFVFDNSWNVSGTATTGKWARVIPSGTMLGNTPANPGADVIGDCGNKSFVTGNNSSSVSADDVDNGYTILSSPYFDLSAYSNPHLKYSRWFFNGGGTGILNDSLVIMLSNGTDTVVIETVTASSPDNSTWVEKDIILDNSMINFSSTMQLIVYVVDAAPDHIVEAGFDYFRIEPGTFIPTISSDKTQDLIIYPNPAKESAYLHFQLPQAPEEAYITIHDITGRTVQQTSINSKSSDILLNESLGGGIYFICYFENNQLISNHKLVILNK